MKNGNLLPQQGKTKVAKQKGKKTEIAAKETKRKDVYCFNFVFLYIYRSKNPTFNNNNKRKVAKFWKF